MEADQKFALNEEARITDEFICPCCGDWVTGYAAIDPIMIDGEPWCDHCVNNLTGLELNE